MASRISAGHIVGQPAPNHFFRQDHRLTAIRRMVNSLALRIAAEDNEGHVPAPELRDAG